MIYVLKHLCYIMKQDADDDYNIYLQNYCCLKTLVSLFFLNFALRSGTQAGLSDGLFSNQKAQFV
jgi:hypothetical protein